MFFILICVCLTMCWHYQEKHLVDLIVECLGHAWRAHPTWLSPSCFTSQSASRQDDLIWCNFLLFGSRADCSICFGIQGPFCLSTGKFRAVWWWMLSYRMVSQKAHFGQLSLLQCWTHCLQGQQKEAEKLKSTLKVCSGVSPPGGEGPGACELCYSVEHNLFFTG